MKVSSIVTIVLLAAGFSGCESSNDKSDPVVDRSVDDAPASVISSRFDVDDETWLITGDAQGSSVAPTYVPLIEEASAHISADDNVAGGTWYFSAPAKFTGNLLDFYAGNLAFELKTTTVENPFDRPDVILSSGDVEISVQLSRLPNVAFTAFSVPLTEANWVDAAGEAIDVNAFTSVLMNVEALRIRGEYNVGADTGGLDNVVLTVPGL